MSEYRLGLIVSKDNHERIRRRVRMLLSETVALGAHEGPALCGLGVGLKMAIQHAASSKSYWHMARTPAVQQALSNAWL